MKNVLITGVSSGIGHAIASNCIKQGFRVFGTVRNDGDANKCSAEFGSSYVPLIMDIKNEVSITNSFEKVKKELKGERLHVLVNNSGIAKAAPLELQKIEEIRETFEVNVLGLLLVTRAFLPLMKQRKESDDQSSKIINISSVAGKSGVPFLGAYVASKHAVEGLSVSLRRELMPFGIDVIVVGPGNVVTPIWDKAVKNTTFDESPYKTSFQKFFHYMITEGSKGVKPEQIAQLVMKIMESPNPKTRYAPVAKKIANWYLPRIIPGRMLDKMMFKMLDMKKVSMP